MKKLLILLFCYFSFSVVFSETLSDKAKVSLITCGYGEELYAKFGHTAIRVYDPGRTPAIDVAYSYGTFNYNVDGFYLKFVKGITDYQLSIEFSQDLFIRYKDRGVAVWEQNLDLTQEEIQFIFEALMYNYLPANRFYRYNYVYDNCATKPRDMVEFVLHEDLVYQKRGADETFRELIAECTGRDTWNKFGIDVVLGSSADKIASARERMFLPLELMHYFKDATTKDGRKVVSNTTQVYKAKDADTTSVLLKPLVVSFVFLFLIAIISYLGRNKKMLCLDAGLFTLFGLIGVVVFYLNFFSVHPLVTGNYNLFWLNPLQLIFAVLLISKRLRKPLLYFQLFNAITVVIAIAGFVIFPQEFNIAFLPLMLLLLMRSLFYIRTQRSLSV